MKQLELMPSQSSTMPKMMGRTKPPSAPTRPTMPVTTPMLCGKSSPTYLNVDAIPQANATPSVKSSNVKGKVDKPMWNCAGPRMVCTIKSVCG